jgi:uncharacterized protein
MSSNRSGIARAAVFFGIVISIAVVIALLGLPDGPTQIFSMVTPTVAVLIMLLVISREGYSRAAWRDLGLHRAGTKRWRFAFFVPIGVVTLAYAIAWGSGIASVDRSQSLPVVPLDFLIVFLILIPLALGEEIGWRGYLLPRLEVLGRGPAMLLSGLLHAIFHFPLIFLTGYYLADGSRWVVVPLFTITLMSAGVLYGYIRLTTDSVWPAAIAHAAHNAITGALSAITIASPLAAAYWLSEGGILLSLGYALCAIWVAVTFLRAADPSRWRRFAPATP